MAIDFYNNYLTNSHDNAIEIDGSLHNIRVMRNMMINSASHPMCNQPAGGGPIYWIRNIVYHAPGGSTRLTAARRACFFYNNTIATETSAGSSANVHWRNNLILGQNSAPRSSASTPHQLQLVGLQRLPSEPRQRVVPVEFAAGRRATRLRLEASGPPKLEARKFATLAEYAQATGQDRHSVLVDYDVFVNVPKLDAKDLATVQRLYNAKDLDFALKPGSAAVDRGVALPNVTDGFSGAAPDLGALEVGKPRPVYGPRPR